MNFSFQELLRVASELFTTPILKVGDIVISLSSLFQLVLSILTGLKLKSRAKTGRMKVY
jgi:hypothetical protein